MNIIQSPDRCSYTALYGGGSLFLAGGISGCFNWQEYVCNQLVEQYKPDRRVHIFNPRRVGNLAKEGDEALAQIKWEHDYLDLVSYISFWFPKETACPITLFELGKYCQILESDYGDSWLSCNDDLIIGMDPNYPRRFDVEAQMKLVYGNKGIAFIYNLDEFIVEIAKKLNLKRKE